MFHLSLPVSRASIRSATDVVRKHSSFWPFATHKVPYSEAHCCCSMQALHLLNHQSTVDPMTGSLSSCCQISERQKEPVSGKDRKRSVMREAAVEWTLSPHPYITFPICCVPSTPSGRRLKNCLLLNH